jgi:hypothetical protein
LALKKWVIGDGYDEFWWLKWIQCGEFGWMVVEKKKKREIKQKERKKKKKGLTGTNKE